MSGEHVEGVRVETERKFLVREGVDPGPPEQVMRIRQAYMAESADCATRVRVVEMVMPLSAPGASITTKFGVLPDRLEMTRAVEVDAAAAMLDSREPYVIDKVRTVHIEHGRRWVVDTFRGRLRGLRLAEIESVMPGDLDEIDLPAWVGREVTSNQNYENRVLARRGVPGRRGRLVVLVGENGAGKTTVARILEREHGFWWHPHARGPKDMLAAIGFQDVLLYGPGGREVGHELLGGRAVRNGLETLTAWGQGYRKDLWHRRWLDTCPGGDVVVDDCRYRHDYEAFFQEGAIIVHVTRGSRIMMLEGVKFLPHKRLYNNKTLGGLEDMTRHLVEDLPEGRLR